MGTLHWVILAPKDPSKICRHVTATVRRVASIQSRETKDAAKSATVCRLAPSAKAYLVQNVRVQ